MGFSTAALTAYLAAAVGAAAVVGVAYEAGKGGKSPGVQPPQQPPGSQASKAPDASTIAKGLAGSGQAGGSPGVAQTFLTGPGGVDPSALQLGRATLLGGGAPPAGGGLGGGGG